MMPKRVFIAAAVAFLAAPCWAGGGNGVSGENERPAAASAADIRNPVKQADSSQERELQDGLLPREPLPKRPTNELAVPAYSTGKVIVKFMDQAKARVRDNDLTTSNLDLLKRNGEFVANDLLAQGLSAAEAIIAGHGLTMSPVISGGEELCQRVEQKAALYSGKAQPDLAGMIYLDGPEGALLGAARQLNGLDVVEFVQFETEMQVAGGTEACCFPQTDECVDLPPEDCVEVLGIPQGPDTDCGDFMNGECPDTGQCCIGDTCFDLTEDECDNIPDSSFRGVGTVCAEADACGDLECGVGEDCFEPNSQGLPFCNDEACCNLVCSLAVFCCENVWDINCAFLAQQLCEEGDPCQSGFTGPCFEAHPGNGCNNASCCDAVCAVNPFCCEVEWDETCVVTANDLCIDPGAGVTPDFSPSQGYLKAGSYIAEEGGVPAPVVPSIRLNPDTLVPLPGWGGEGIDLAQFETLLDQLNQQAPQDIVNWRGEGVRVAVIEHSAFVNHEDLDVTPEPDQTILTLPGTSNLTGDHGTACLGIIGARDEGDDFYDTEVGCVGIAPGVDLWFFPIVSAEEGGRLLNAVTNCIDRFEPGDMMSFSIGPGGTCGTLVSSEAEWTLLNVATDAGISASISAGNSCCNLDTGPQAQTGGGMTIVGANFPGAPFCRLGFSNHCEECEQDIGNVDVSAWGAAVTTTGYGDAFFGDGDKNRSYTTAFNGTSAACPMYVGVLARLQAFAKDFYGIPLSPEQIRSASTGGRPQCLLPPALLPGAPGGFECLGDFDPDEEPNEIHNFVQAAGNAESVIAGSYFDGSDPLVEVFVLRGLYVSGNDNSIRTSDDSYLIVDSRFQNRPVDTSHPDLPEANRALYLAPGETVDVAALINSIEDVDPPAITLAVEVRFPPPFGIVVVEMYDYDANNWRFVAMESVTGGADDQTFDGLDALNAQGLVRNSDGRSVARVYTVALGANPHYRLRVDLIDVDIFGTGVGDLP